MSNTSTDEPAEQTEHQPDPRTVVATVVLEYPPEQVDERDLSDEQLQAECQSYVDSEGISPDDIDVVHRPSEALDLVRLAADRFEIVDVLEKGAGSMTFLVDTTQLDDETIEERLQREYDPDADLVFYREGSLDVPLRRAERDSLAVIRR